MARNPRTLRHLRDAIIRRVDAEVAFAFKGAGLPEHIPLIKQDLRDAKINLNDKLRQVEAWLKESK